MKTMTDQTIKEKRTGEVLVTLIGPPNSGKTTLFNFLSGRNNKTVNYPGSTIEYSISNFKLGSGISGNILDSPGIISLMPGSPDEEVAVNSLFEHPKHGSPDLVMVTADCTQLARHLFLAKQIKDSGFPVLIVLTMPDILDKNGYGVHPTVVSKYMDCDVVAFDGRNDSGGKELLDSIKSYIEIKRPYITRKIDYSDSQYLIDVYNFTEKIEEEAVYNKSFRANPKDIRAANEQLVVLNNGSIQKRSSIIDKATLKIDNILLHKVWGIAAFFAIMTFFFTAIFWLAVPLMDLVDQGFAALASFASGTLGANWFGDLISDGIISGLGSVMVFLPQIAILFLILGVLEDTGYLARGAMLIDKPLSKLGLNGRSFVPMLSGFACAIPAMMAARTIPNKRERLLTIFVVPLLSCSARLPVYALLLAFITPPDKPWIGGLSLTGIYLASILGSSLVAVLINKSGSGILKADDKSSFILELPNYKMPKARVVFKNALSSSYQYIKKAGPVILVFSILLWFLSYFPNSNPTVETAGLTPEEVETAVAIERVNTSYAAELGRFIQPVMEPVGMDWRIGVSMIASFAAREVFVSSMAMVFKVSGDEETIQSSILNSMRQAEIYGTGQKLFTTSTIIGLVVFFIFAMQCMSTLAVSRQETGGWRIPALQLVGFTGAAYLLMFITVNGLRLLGVA